MPSRFWVALINKQLHGIPGFNVAVADNSGSTAWQNNVNIFSAPVYISTLNVSGYRASEQVAMRINYGIVEGYVCAIADEAYKDGTVEIPASVFENAVGYAGITVQAYEAGTSNLLGSAVTNADGYYMISSLGTTDVDIVFVNPGNSSSYLSDMKFIYTSLNGNGTTISSPQAGIDATITNVTPTTDYVNSPVDASAMFNVAPGNYIVTFVVPDGASKVSSTVVKEGNTVPKPSSPTWAHHSFVNWYTDDRYGTVFDFTNTEIYENTTIYGKFDTNDYEISYDPTTGTGTMASDYHAYGATHTLKANEFTHADVSGVAVVFMGWSETADTTIYALGDTLPTMVTQVFVDGDKTVYAVWGYDTNGNGKPDPLETKYKINYDANGASRLSQ